MKKVNLLSNLPKLDNVQMFYLFCADTSLKIESK